MRPKVIRWKRHAPNEAKADCAAFLRAQGYGLTVTFGQLWLVGRGWS